MSIVQYTLAKSTPTGGNRVLRRTGMTMPDSTAVTYNFGSANGINDCLARVGCITAGGHSIALYYYTGAGVLTNMDYNEPLFLNRRATTTLGDYPGWDQFNRVITSDWYAAINAPVAMYDVDITYDRAGNITQAVDNVRLDAADNRRFDALYTLDGLYRVTQTDEGKIVTGAIASGDGARQEIWQLG
jgi:hypothetical protein